MPYIKVKEFDLKETLESGQFFRYTEHRRIYTMIVREKVFQAEQDKDKLYYNGASKEFIEHFFALDHNIINIHQEISKDELMRQAISAHRGLRILRQDPYECALSFLLSSCSNIPRITSLVNLLTEKYGDKIVKYGKVFNVIKKPLKFPSETALRQLRTGFRAKYLFQSQKELSSINNLRKYKYSESKKMLTKINGIGEKIADCILLFAFGHLNAFPIDTWIKKVVTHQYFKGEKTGSIELKKFSEIYYGRYAGYAQQYLFTYSRKNWRNFGFKGKIKKQSNESQNN